MGHRLGKDRHVGNGRSCLGNREQASWTGRWLRGKLCEMNLQREVGTRLGTAFKGQAKEVMFCPRGDREPRDDSEQ